MKVYSLKQTQILPISIEEAWDFFSTPDNLNELTPAELAFKRTSEDEPRGMFAGQLFTYKIRLGGIPMTWVTEITHVFEQDYFVDQQRFGPYKMWHHRHQFKAIGPNKVEMLDHVQYGIPMGFLGRLANAMFVGKQVREIFEFRRKKLEELFPEK